MSVSWAQQLNRYAIQNQALLRWLAGFPPLHSPDKLANLLQVFDEARHLLVPRFVIWRPQQGRGMHRRNDMSRQGRIDPLAVLAQDAEVPTEQSLRRSRSQANQNFRMDGFEFSLEPGATGADFGGSWLLVNSALAAFGGLPFEMLDDVCNENFVPIDSGLLERAIEKKSSWSNEGMTGTIFAVSRLFADKQNGCAARTFTEYGLRRVLP